MSRPRWRGSSHQRGRAAEDAATRWLERRGYRIVERNVRTAAGEIDLVAVDGETLCFIEVKARQGDRYGRAVGSLGLRQQGRLARAAALFLAGHDWDGPCRFDVVGLERGPQGWSFELVADAFEAPPG